MSCRLSRSWKKRLRRGPASPSTRTGLEPGNSAWPRRKSATCMTEGLLTFHSPGRFATRCLRKGLPRSTAGSPTQAGFTFRLRSSRDLPHALWLMRLSYFRYALKTAADPRELFAEVCQELQLAAPFKPLLRSSLYVQPKTRMRIYKGVVAPTLRAARADLKVSATYEAERGSALQVAPEPGRLVYVYCKTSSAPAPGCATDHAPPPPRRLAPRRDGSAGLETPGEAYRLSIRLAPVA